VRHAKVTCTKKSPHCQQCCLRDECLSASVGHFYVCLRSLRNLKYADTRRNPPTRLVALSRIAPRRKCPWGITQHMHVSGRALRGLQTKPGSVLSLLNRQPACLRNDALILFSSVSQRPQAINRSAL